MKQLLIIHDPQSTPGVRFYRMSPFYALPREEFSVDEMEVHQALSNEQWAWGRYDAVILKSYHNQDVMAAAQIAKAYGLKVVIDIDDMGLEIPEYNTAIKYFSHPQAKNIIASTLSLADLIIASTPAIKIAYSGMTKAKIVVIPNAYHDNMFGDASKVKPAKKPVQMAWRGGKRHSGDLESVRKPMAEAMNNPGLQWKFWGGNPNESAPFLKAHPAQWEEWQSALLMYFMAFARSEPDWLFVPLDVNTFNKAKSNCSAIEALMLAGAGVIAPYGLPEFQHPGVVRYKDNADLSALFKKIGKGEVSKEETVHAGQQWILENRALSKVNEMRVQAFQDIL